MGLIALNVLLLKTIKNSLSLFQVYNDYKTLLMVAKCHEKMLAEFSVHDQVKKRI